MFIGRLSANEQQRIIDLTKCHVPPRHILLSLQEEDLENVTQITKIYKNKSKFQKEVRGLTIEIQYLCKLIDDACYVYWSRIKDE